MEVVVGILVVYVPGEEVLPRTGLAGGRMHHRRLHRQVQARQVPVVVILEVVRRNMKREERIGLFKRSAFRLAARFREKT